jgi:hypothetical protein
MLRRPRIELPRPSAETLHVGRVVAVALGSLACGLAIGATLLPRTPSSTGTGPTAALEEPSGVGAGDASVGQEPGPAASPSTRTEAEARDARDAADAGAPVAIARPQPEPLPQAAATTASATAPTQAEEEHAAQADLHPARPATVPTPEAALPPVRARDEARAPIAPIAAAPETSSAATMPAARDGSAASRALRITPTTVAYVRCDGLERPGTRFPCPRDRPLEQRAQAIVTALPSCLATGQLRRGELEVRLALSPVGAVSLREVRARPPVTQEAISACIEPAVRGLTTTLQPQLGIVVLRFEVR